MLRTYPASTSLHAATAAAVALCASVDLPEAGGAPDWIHLLPATPTIHTGDGRGPYRVTDMGALALASLQAGQKLPIDENHATDLAAPSGLPAPARGWIVALQARDTGLWGQVEWTATGRRLVEGRAYRGISPAIQHLQDGTITAVLRASLVNLPNLRGLTALHSENSMDDLLARLLAALSLPAATTEDALVSAITAMHAQQTQSSTALQAALDPIATTVGLQAGASAAAVLTGVQAVAATAAGKMVGNETVTALQAELAQLGAQFQALQDTSAREKAVAFVDGAIKAGTVGVKPLRDHYVTMHMADPARVEKELAALPKLGASGVLQAPPQPANGEVALNAEQANVAKVLGIDPAAMAATLKAERAAAEAL